MASGGSFFIYLFRDQIRTMLLTARRVKAFGAEAEFAEIDNSIEHAGRKLTEVTQTSGKTESTRPDPRSFDKDLVDSLTDVNFSDLNSRPPLEAAAEATRRLSAAAHKILSHFGIPGDVIDSDSAGRVMSRITGDQRWPEVLSIIEDLNEASKRMTIFQGKPWPTPAKLNEAAKKLVGSTYRMRRVLPSLFTVAGPS
jgi:hypothetical protein